MQQYIKEGNFSFITMEEITANDDILKTDTNDKIINSGNTA